MTKGKQAALSARRQLAGAMDHLSAVTDELAELKVRTRDAEARAFHAEQRAKNAEHKGEADAELVRQCAELIEDHRARKRRRRAEWDHGVKDDFGQMMRDLPVPQEMGIADKVELLGKRYPKLFAYLSGDKWPDLHRGRHMQHLTEDRVRSLGRALGERVSISWDPERDAADVANDLMDVRLMSLSAEEMAELLDVEANR